MLTAKVVKNLILVWNFYWIIGQCVSLRNRCLGGPSLRGVEDISTIQKEVSCCDDSGCYGYHPSLVEYLLNNSLELPRKIHLKSSLVERSAQEPIQRTRAKDVKKVDDFSSASCCSSNVSVLFPISAVSATKLERVTIVQIPSLQQPVIYQLCSEEPCQLLRGNCTQIYIPQQLYIITQTSVASAPKIVMDNVFVENGCTCSTSLRENSARISGLIDFDPTITKVIQQLTHTPSENLQNLGDIVNGSQQIPPAVPLPPPVPEPQNSARIRERLSMPKLPLPGYPISISQGCFHPILQLLQSYTSEQNT